MSESPANQGDPKQSLSALVDGELDGASVQRMCAAWRDDASVRSTWHAYHLIGDVLRSDDLASAGRHDEAFLTALRARLADEPVVLAPQPRAVPAEAAAAVLASAPRRRMWAAPMAVAAGFVAVAGVLVVTRVAGPVGGGAMPATTLASVQGAAPQVRAVAASAAMAPDAPIEVSTALGPDLKLIRDARLDRYLAAHKQFDRGAAVSVPGAMLRNAAAVAPER
jgi:sigma-E factor negative regulatory protein RseA